MESKNMLTLASGTKVMNVKTTKLCLPRHYNSWKKFYESLLECSFPNTCPILDCKRRAVHGGHVIIKRVPGIWIIPLCAKHNAPTNEGEMPVSANTIAVEVDEEDTHGPPPVCYSKKNL